MQLTSKTALVTGAANRLGAQIARTLHQNGANLIIHYRRSVDAAQQLADELNTERAGSAISFGADLAIPDELESLAATAISAFDGLDLLVNNASTFYATRFGEIDEKAWQDLTNSNFKAPLFLSQACYPTLAKKAGCIINMLDIYGARPLPQHSVYCAAKAANQMLVKSLAVELAPEVRVNGIAPGAILWPEHERDEDKQQALLEQIPLARCGTATEIADTVVFLATNDYITGEIIRVDGGRLLKG